MYGRMERSLTNKLLITRAIPMRTGSWGLLGTIANVLVAILIFLVAWLGTGELISA